MKVRYTLCCTLWALLAGLLVQTIMPRACAQRKPDSAQCLSCHSDSTLTTEEQGKPVSLFVDSKKLEHSIHGSLSCVDCHKDIKESPHTDAPKKVVCADCHDDVQQSLRHGMHANTVTGSNTPGCLDCHGGPHQILAASDQQSPVSHNAIPATCGKCHGQKFLMASSGQGVQSYLSYQESVHGKATASGKTNAAVCTDCHGAHTILAPNDAHSPINKFNVPKTCGQCHATVADTYTQSIHGQAVARGNGMAPVCTDCHGIHSIQSHLDPASPVSEQNLARDTCARCHEGVKLSREFGIAGNRVSSYMDSYHGLAAEGGSTVAANCASCHGVHNILPSSDPRSTINHANLAKTCGQCHPGVTQKFTETKVHIGGASARDAATVATRWVRWIYLPLIILVIGGMFLHNVVLWRARAAKMRRLHRPMIVRMTAQQRAQHLVLLLSFIVLVLTGFALRFPNSWLAQILGGESEKLRSILHRIAGVVLIGAGLWHIVYVLITREGRKLFLDFLPSGNDIADLFRTMAWHLGLRKEKPAFGRFNYAEKAEYWSLIWGTVLMALTGIMLWGKVWVGNLLARWWVDAATAVHFYEAVLATLAILVWHFYQVFFDPDVYPMNHAWLDGKMTLERYKEEHGLDTESIAEAEAASGELKSDSGEPHQS